MCCKNRVKVVNGRDSQSKVWNPRVVCGKNPQKGVEVLIRPDRLGKLVRSFNKRSFVKVEIKGQIFFIQK